ncbi:MAG: hypothetical protein HYU86_04850 [Chloroflexi bacterium]|nr:hypothetical protein [Chloroflexota bacterium]
MIEPTTIARNVAQIPDYEEGKPPRPLFDVDYMSELEAMWGRKWGAQTDLGKLRMVLVSKPVVGELTPEHIEEMKRAPALYGLVRGIPDLKKQQEQHANFVTILRSHGVEVVDLNLPPEPRGIYVPVVRGVRGTRDIVVINGGAIIPRNAIATKRGCEPYWAQRVIELGCPILYTVHGSGCFEGGNVCWLDSKHVMIGVGLRGNLEGIRQVEFVMRNAGVEDVHVVYLAGYLNKALGYQHHLDCVFNMVDEGLAVCYVPGIDYLSLDHLIRKGIKLIEVPPEEMRNAACNCLAIEPGKVIMVAGNPYTHEALVKEGCEVIEVDWSEYTKQGGGASGGGGPICATAPLIRDPGPMLK